VEGDYPWGIYHGANEGGCSWYEFAQEIFKLKNIKVNVTPVKSDFFPRPAKRPKYSVLLNTKLSKQRGWKEALGEYLVNF
jgi:dTDP-4-dehydrorhamnose reductase